MTRGSIRLGTPEEFDRFYLGRIKPAAWLGYVREVEGVIVATAGIYWDHDGRAWGFIDCRRKYMPDTKSVVRMTRCVMDAMRGCGQDVVFAKPDMRIPKAEYFLKWLGFKPMTDNSGVWAWQAH